MKSTSEPWTIYGDDTHIFIGNMQSNDTRACDGIRMVCEVKQSDYELPDYAEAMANARLIVVLPELLAALKETQALLVIARQYFPKSIHNHDRFQLESASATLGTAIAKATTEEEI
jgi:hypothetical protein